MKSGLEKEWKKVLQKEEKFLRQRTKEEKESKDGLMAWVREKVPPKLISALETAFRKAFYIVFEKGSGIVEKTFSKEDMSLEFAVNDFRIEQSPTRKSMRKMERLPKKNGRINACMTTVEGVGLGLLGIGLPDIPLFLGMLMKGLYETAIGYGFVYDTKEERIFLLRIIAAALAEPAERTQADRRVEDWMKNQSQEVDFDQEIERAADAMSAGMLAAKFVQGLPLVGAAGGAYNLVIYRKVQQYAALKYKKRYLMEKMKKHSLDCL